MNSELVKYARRLKMDLPRRQSAFLWGARKTGKSTYLKDRFPESIRYDLLESDLFFKLSKRPSLLREELLGVRESDLHKPVIIDEIQKIPALLDEVHWLIENRRVSFVLCGSSARKLKKGGTNLLGGRAWRYEMYPLTYPEIPDFDLMRALNHGLVPPHYLSVNHKKSLQAYVLDYLQEEIRAEGLTRNLPAFARFLDSLAFSSGELVNYSSIARDCGVDSKTVREYYQILVDSHLGYLIFPYAKRVKRELIAAAPKFYFFDVGVAGHLQKRRVEELRGEGAGRAFEHFILMELVACRSYRDLDFEIHFWRTKTGLETDFILGRGEVAVEVKISGTIDGKDLRGLGAFVEEHKPARAILVCNERRARRLSGTGRRPMDILPWRKFLDLLWEGEIIS